MAQVKLLKISADGVPLEMDIAADDITLNSFTAGAGPVMSPTGIDMNVTDLSDVANVVFTNPATGTINQTSGNLIVNNIMAKERENLMTTAGGISFPVITDVAGQVDNFRIPALAAIPTATPTTGGSGHLVFDSANKNLYIWDGSAWDNLNTTTDSQNLVNNYTAAAAVAARDLVYISAADSVTPANASSPATSYTIGFARAAAAVAATVPVISEGILTGFTGLTPGAMQYLSGTTAGAITPTIPTASGSSIVLAGYAKSATAIHINIQHLGRRA